MPDPAPIELDVSGELSPEALEVLAELLCDLAEDS